MAHKKNDWQISNEAKAKFERRNPRPEYTPPTVDRPQIVRHGKGRVWVELEKYEQTRLEPDVVVHVVHKDMAYQLDCNRDELETLYEQLGYYLAKLGEVNKNQMIYNAALKSWHSRQEKFADEAISLAHQHDKLIDPNPIPSPDEESDFAPPSETDSVPF